MICNRLSWWCEHFNKLSHSQFGFRKGKSCADNISILHSDIIQGFNENKVTTTVFLGIKGAYNEVRPNILIDKLEKIGLYKCMLKFIYKLIFLRHLYIRYGEIDEYCRTYRDVTQAGVLSPLLYGLYQGERYRR